MIPTTPLASLVLAAALIGAQAATAIAQPPRDATPVAAEAGVPMFRADPAHTGAHPGPGPVGHPVVRWRVDLGGMVLGSPAVVDAIVYVGSNAEPAEGPIEDNTSCVLHALDAATGAERWRFVGACGSPAVVGGLVYATSSEWNPDDGELVALDATSGRERWRFDTDGRLGMAPTVAAGVVYVGGESGFERGPDTKTGLVYALDAATGRQRWRIWVGDERESTVDSVDSSPAVADGVIFFGIDHSGMYAVDAATGAERWRFRPGRGMFASPAADDGVVYNGAGDGSVYALDRATGRERWRFRAGDAVAASPAVVDGVVYAGGLTEPADPDAEAFGTGTLYALDAATGQERWRLDGGPGATSSPAVVAGVVYVGGMTLAADGAPTGALHALDAATGAELWRIETGPVFSSPAVVDGVVYVADIDGVLYAVGGSAGA